jgi:hypothetical protein
MLAAPGVVIVASDRQYFVAPQGNWRRLAKHEEEKVEFKWPEIPFCVDGRSPDGSRCYCFPCLERRKNA